MKLRNRLMSAKTASDVMTGEIDNLKVLEHYKKSPATMKPMENAKKMMDATVNSDFRRAVLRCNTVRDVMKLGGKGGKNEGLKRSLSNFIEQLTPPLQVFENEVESMSLRIDLEKNQNEKRQKIA